MYGGTLKRRCQAPWRSRTATSASGPSSTRGTRGRPTRPKSLRKEDATFYRLADGREFKSLSAAGTAITEKACNGWAFWSVGDGAENTGPVSSSRVRPPAKSTITPAPKPQVKPRGRKGQTAEPPASDGSQ